MNCNYNIINKRLINNTCDVMMDKMFEIELTKDKNGNVNNNIMCSKVIMYLKDNKYIHNEIYQCIMKVLQSGKDKYKKEISLILNNIDLTNKESITIISEHIVNYYKRIYNEINNECICDGMLINEKEIFQDSSILSIIETYFDDKIDVELLKELITSKNNNILNKINAFVKDNNINKFINELKTFLITYKEQQTNTINEQLNTYNNIQNNNQSYSSTQKWSINNMNNICERTELSEDIIYFIMKQLSYEEKIYFNYQRKVNPNYYEVFEFQKSNTEHSIELITQKCKEFLNEIIIKIFNNDNTKTEKFNLLLRKKSPKIQDAFNSFLNHLDKTQLQNDIQLILNSTEITKTNSTINKKPLHKKSNTFFGVNVVNGNFSFFNQPDSVQNNSKSESNEFIKQIQKMPSLNKEQKSKAIDLYNLHDPKMIKLFCMYKRNKTSLTKQLIVKAISGLSTTVTTSVNTLHHNNNKLKQKHSCHNNNKKTEFEMICNDFVNDKLLTQNEVEFLINKYKCNDETLQSFYEVYIGLKDKEDLLESFKMYLKKNNCNVNNNITLQYILSKSNFTQHMKQIVLELYSQQNVTLLSFIEVYNQDKDIDETIESIELLLKKISYVN